MPGSRLYSTLSSAASLEKNIDTTSLVLDPWFVTGFCDGESNFLVSITPSTDHKLKCRVRIMFQIFLSIKDMPLLLKIKEFFGGWYCEDRTK